MSWLHRSDFGLLILRVSAGLMMFFGHGWGKLEKIGTEAAANFADPFGFGAVSSHFLAASAEGLGSLFLVAGLFTRGSSLALAFTMFVAAFFAHANDPFFPKKEFALLYATIFSGLVFLGAGKWSVDHQIRGRLPRVLKWIT